MTKTFKFTDKTDYIFYLSELISDLLQKTSRLEKYDSQINDLIALNHHNKIIQADIYEEMSDKTCRIFQYLFNLLGDESKKAVSYKKFRKILFKNQKNIGITLDELPQNEIEILGRFHTLRTWSLHIPESLFIQKKEFFQLDSEFIKQYQDKIPVPIYRNFEIKFLIELHNEVQTVLHHALYILNRMKKDYSILIAQSVQIEYEINEVKPYAFMTVVKNSQ
ncbi:hypothetical protein [Wohlfahrtiimonas populi]|uniref:hypothetical protein n=1 Tax=Wohlfahrtiimonas populi TaxID=1940240 RepID=UPI00117E9556|nr:hypothetical protein [Wohlfahrtiimonas populi]